MGCGPSKPHTHASNPPSQGAKPPTQQKKSPQPLSRNDNKSSGYETQLSASLVDSTSTSVPFHGLLNDKHKLDLKRHANSDPQNKLFDRTCHPSDDAMETSSDSRLTILTGVAMTMPYTIIVAQPDATVAVEKIITPLFDRTNAVYNAWNPASEISKLNKLPPEKKVPLSSHLASLFDVVDTAFDMTDGKFDPTSGVLSVAFENCITQKERPPLPAEIAPFKHAIGWKRRIIRKSGSIHRMNAHTVADLDGISKGFVIDAIVIELMNNGFYDCYVDWAGDVRAVGSHPDGRPWRSAVVRPPELSRVFSHWQNSTLREMINADDTAYFADFAVNGVNGCAIATSGDYFAMHKYGFHHIASIEDMTVMKATYLSVGSVCVAANTCAIADAIATAAMTFREAEETVSFLERLKSSYSNIVYGYCVMGRNRPSKRRVEVITQGIFEVADSVPNSTTTEALSPEGASNSAEGDENFAAQISGRLYKSLCEVQFGGSSLVIDSLVSCSMNPHPLVTFFAPFDIISHLTDEKNDVLSKMKLFLLKPSAAGLSTHLSGVSVDLRYVGVFRVNDIACVFATIEDVDFGSVKDYTITHNDLSVKYEVQLGVVRSQFQLMPILNKAKVLMRNIPSMIWVVSIKAEDGSPVALTATSVRVPQDGDGHMYFNVAHSSTFYAYLGGEGSAVNGYALSTSLSDLATKFVSDCRPTKDDMARLQNESIVAATCIISQKHNLQDHLVVIGTLCEVSDLDKSGSRKPLLWLHGDYKML